MQKKQNINNKKKKTNIFVHLKFELPINFIMLRKRIK